MKGGKEEDKVASPMFPRLHVNDTDKGGPRAPPRNKMALYEQLSIPSQRFSSSSLPLLLQNAGNVAPSSQGNSQEGAVFSPFYLASSVPAYSVEKVNTQSSEDVRKTKMVFEIKSTRHVNFKSPTSIGPAAECSSHRQDDSTVKNSCQRTVEEDDDFRVPIFGNYQQALNLKKDTTGLKKRSMLHTNSQGNNCLATFDSSAHFASPYGKRLEESGNSNSKTGKRERSREDELNDAVTLELKAKKSKFHPEAGEKLAEPSRSVKSSIDREAVGSQEECVNGSLDSPDPFSESQKASYCRMTLSVTAANCNQTGDDKENRSMGIGDADRNCETSDTSMVDSISGLEISPDDVVGLIGSKQFWKARKAIVNQQRVFGLQVFELHRLIKVQKLLAASPHLLLEDTSCIAPPKVSSKSISADICAKSRSQAVTQKEDSQKPSQNTDCRKESAGVAPRPAQNDLPVSLPCHSPGCGNAPSTPPASENRSNPWCFQPPEQQWLLPVMSPSEGLIYKPYAGPCPPPTAFMTPVYGNFGPMSLPAGYPVPQQQLGVPPNYLATPYSLQPMNSMMSNSAVDQTTPVNGSRPNVLTEQYSRGSCNMAFPRSDAFAGRPRKANESKESEMQGSTTASSPCKKAQEQDRDALPLFPLEPTVETSVIPSESDDMDQQIHVIRVIPHNASSATESAARIFKSIQEERQQLDQ